MNERGQNIDFLIMVGWKKMERGDRMERKKKERSIAVFFPFFLLPVQFFFFITVIALLISRIGEVQFSWLVPFFPYIIIVVYDSFI